MWRNKKYYLASDFVVGSGHYIVGDVHFVVDDVHFEVGVEHYTLCSIIIKFERYGKV